MYELVIVNYKNIILAIIYMYFFINYSSLVIFSMFC